MKTQPTTNPRRRKRSGKESASDDEGMQVTTPGSPLPHKFKKARIEHQPGDDDARPSKKKNRRKKERRRQDGESGRDEAIEEPSPKQAGSNLPIDDASIQGQEEEVQDEEDEDEVLDPPPAMSQVRSQLPDDSLPSSPSASPPAAIPTAQSVIESGQEIGEETLESLANMVRRCDLLVCASGPDGDGFWAPSGKSLATTRTGCFKHWMAVPLASRARNPTIRKPLSARPVSIG